MYVFLLHAPLLGVTLHAVYDIYKYKYNRNTVFRNSYTNYYIALS
jgi:hypothetical protein